MAKAALKKESSSLGTGLTFKRFNPYHHSWEHGSMHDTRAVAESYVLIGRQKERV